MVLRQRMRKYLYFSMCASKQYVSECAKEHPEGELCETLSFAGQSEKHKQHQRCYYLCKVNMTKRGSRMRRQSSLNIFKRECGLRPIWKKLRKEPCI